MEGRRDPRRYNRPQHEEVTAVYVDHENGPPGREMIIHPCNAPLQYLRNSLPNRDLISYPLNHPYFHPNCKNIVISSSPIVRTDRNEGNNILKIFNTILKQEEKNVIFHNNISASHLHRDGLHLNLNGTIMLAGNLLSRIRTF